MADISKAMVDAGVAGIESLIVSLSLDEMQVMGEPAARALVYEALEAALRGYTLLVTEPSSYMVGTGSGAVMMPLAFRASLQEAQLEREVRGKAYPNAAIYALREVGGSRG